MRFYYHLSSLVQVFPSNRRYPKHCDCSCIHSFSGKFSFGQIISTVHKTFFSRQIGVLLLCCGSMTLKGKSRCINIDQSLDPHCFMPAGSESYYRCQTKQTNGLPCIQLAQIKEIYWLIGLGGNPKLQTFKPVFEVVTIIVEITRKLHCSFRS